MATETVERFDPQAHMGKINTRQGPQQYLSVKHRVLWIRADHPEARIVTEKLDGGLEYGWVEFKCTITILSGVTRGGEGPAFEAVAVGHGSETREDFPDYYEKAETKAIGRACATLGYGTDAAADFDDGEPLDGAGAAKAERAQRMTAIAQGPQRDPGQIDGVTRGVPATQRPAAAPARAAQARPPANATQSAAATAPYPYADIFDSGTRMDAINQYLGECRLPNNGNMGVAIRTVNDYGKRVHGQETIVIGTGDWNEQYQRFDIRPRDIGNALAHWVAQESTAGTQEMQAAMERDTANEADNWDDVPF